VTDALVYGDTTGQNALMTHTPASTIVKVPLFSVHTGGPNPETRIENIDVAPDVQLADGAYVSPTKLPIGAGALNVMFVGCQRQLNNCPFDCMAYVAVCKTRAST